MGVPELTWHQARALFHYLRPEEIIWRRIPLWDNFMTYGGLSRILNVHGLRRLDISGVQDLTWNDLKDVMTYAKDLRFIYFRGATVEGRHFTSNPADLEDVPEEVMRTATAKTIRLSVERRPCHPVYIRGTHVEFADAPVYIPAADRYREYLGFYLGEFAGSPLTGGKHPEHFLTDMAFTGVSRAVTWRRGRLGETRW